MARKVRTSKGPDRRARKTRKSAGPSRARKAPAAGSPPGAKGLPERQVRDFVQGLAEKERIVLIVRDELFGGSWENMRKDLKARAAGKAYVFKLASRIEEDLKAVEKLTEFERRSGVNLADYP